MRLICALLLVASTVATAAPSRSELQDYRGILDQARFQIRKEFWDQAERDLERAVEHPDGAADAEAWFLLAQVRYQRADLPGALQAAERALTNARDPNQAEQTKGILSFLSTGFARVTVQGTQPGLRWHPRLELQGTLFDPEQQAWVERLTARLRRERPLLPHTIGLPTSTWTLNGLALDLKPGDHVRMELAPRAASGGLAVARLAWLEVSSGVSVWLRGAPNLLPSPTTQVSVSVPVGGIWVVGMTGQHTATAYRAEDAVYRFEPRSASAGARVGPLFDDGERFLVRPAVGYRFGVLGAARLGCTRDGSDWRCDGGPTDRAIYASGPAHFLTAELALDYLDRRRTTALGAGVKIIAEQAFGALPQTLDLRDEPTSSVTLSAAERVPARTALHLLANLSIAF